MEQQLISLIRLARNHKATDIHFTRRKRTLDISFRQPEGLTPLKQDIFGPSLFEYLKFRTGMDLTQLHSPQSGAATIDGIDCRFAILPGRIMETGVLRLMQADVALEIDELSWDPEITGFFHSLAARTQGLVLFAGPTGSGKTTTQHAILREASLIQDLKCVSLEDPVEIQDESYIQVAVDEEHGLTYERGIEELMRHDPDIICIQEVRTYVAASRLFTACLTGHFCLATIHASDGRESLWRLKDLGIPETLIREQLDAVVSQRLYMDPVTGRKEVCIHEIIRRPEIFYLLEYGSYPKEFRPLAELVHEAAEAGYILEADADRDFPG